MHGIPSINGNRQTGCELRLPEWPEARANRKRRGMSDRFNTIAGWTLFAGIVALGAGIVGTKLFHQERPEPMDMRSRASRPRRRRRALLAGPRSTRCSASSDVAKGEKVFAKCMACHTIDTGAANGIGPNLYGIVGDSKAEGRGGFAFSRGSPEGGRRSGLSRTCDKWLTNPKAMASGTKMSFA